MRPISRAYDEDGLPVFGAASRDFQKKVFGTVLAQKWHSFVLPDWHPPSLFGFRLRRSASARRVGAASQVELRRNL